MTQRAPFVSNSNIHKLLSLSLSLRRVCSRASIIIRFEPIHLHFRLIQFTSTESIQRIFIESISTPKLSVLSAQITAIFMLKSCYCFDHRS